MGETHDDHQAPPGATSGVRRPPYSEEAERGVLGSVLQDAAILDLCVERQLIAESFYVPAHRILWDALAHMSQQSRPIDALTVAHELKESGNLDRIGGEIFLHRLIDSTPTTAHAGYYVDIVRQKHIYRQVIECSRNAENECYSSDEDALTLLGRVEQSFFDITDKNRAPMGSWPDMVRGVMEQVEAIGKGGDVSGIKTGYVDIDRHLAGLRPGNMIVLAARPSMGKTSLGMNIAEKVARGHVPGGEPTAVGIFSLEMSREDLVMRMLCSHARVSMHRIRQGYLSSKGNNDEHRRLVEAADVLGKAPIFLDDSPGLDITELRARARRMKQKHGVRLIIVDYLQLLHSREHARQGRQFEIAEVSGNIKGMAKELGLPVMVLSQLSRAPEARDVGKPRLSDLRDSGSIEQDADIVLLLRRPCKYPEDSDHEDRRLAVIDIAKNRNGPAHDGIRLSFEEDITLFEDRAEEHGVDGFAQEPYGEGDVE
jgi:replicative DNA helicase